MDTDDLRRAYDRFKALSPEDQERLDPICDAIGEYMLKDWRDRGSKGGYISPNRIAALLALEKVREWLEAEWQA